MLMAGMEERNKKLETEREKYQRLKRKREQELVDMFYLFDKDRSGAISSDEMSSIMTQFGKLSKEEVDIMLKEADADGNGEVSK